MQIFIRLADTPVSPAFQSRLGITFVLGREYLGKNCSMEIRYANQFDISICWECSGLRFMAPHIQEPAGVNRRRHFRKKIAALESWIGKVFGLLRAGGAAGAASGKTHYSANCDRTRGYGPHFDQQGADLALFRRSNCHSGGP